MSFFNQKCFYRQRAEEECGGAASEELMNLALQDWVSGNCKKKTCNFFLSFLKYTGISNWNDQSYSVQNGHDSIGVMEVQQDLPFMGLFS